MMRFSTLLKHPSDWMTGHDAETSVVVTSRVRLARNLKSVPFPGWATKGQRGETFFQLKDLLQELPVMSEGFAHELRATKNKHCKFPSILAQGFKVLEILLTPPSESANANATARAPSIPICWPRPSSALHIWPYRGT